MSSDVEHDAKKGRTISRRRFFRNAVAGAAGTALALSSAREGFAQQDELGRIMLDALLISYYSAAVGSAGIPRWTLKGDYANTVRLRVREFPDLALRPKPDPGDRIIFAGHEIEQIKSGQVKNGMIMRHKGFGGLTFGFGLEDVIHTREDTTFFSILRPQLQIVGSPNKPRFRFIGDVSGNGGVLFPQTVSELESDDGVRFLSRETVDSWLRQYTTDPAELLKQRYKLKASTGFVSAGVEAPLKLNEDGDKDFSSARTATTTARIIQQTGFTSDALKQVFAVGNHLDITHTAVQEIESVDTVKMQVTIKRASDGVNRIYWDRVFKTFVIIDGGLSAD